MRGGNPAMRGRLFQFGGNLVQPFRGHVSSIDRHRCSSPSPTLHFRSAHDARSIRFDP
jgi:hypothetical protein